MKTCSKCLLSKPLSEFYACAAYKGGYKHTCKACHASNRKRYGQNNIEVLHLQQVEWKEKNRQLVNQKQREWRTNTRYMANYLSNDNHKIAHNLRVRLGKLLKGKIKVGSAVDNLSCSVEELRCHLESQFEPWMNWDNYGKHDPNRPTWNIDHITPLIKFDLTDLTQLNEACRYTNLQPMLAKANSSKGGR